MIESVPEPRRCLRECIPLLDNYPVIAWELIPILHNTPIFSACFMQNIPLSHILPPLLPLILTLWSIVIDLVINVSLEVFHQTVLPSVMSTLVWGSVWFVSRGLHANAYSISHEWHIGSLVMRCTVIGHPWVHTGVKVHALTYLPTHACIL